HAPEIRRHGITQVLSAQWHVQQYLKPLRPPPQPLSPFDAEAPQGHAGRKPLDRTATLRRFAAPAAICAAILVAAYVRTAEGTRHPSPWGYRLWSFAALAYSDILALHEDRGAGRHPLPYVEDKVEYPV